jgi:hypothetical protein
MKTTKRFVALLMAVVMTFALGAVALAEPGVFRPTTPGENFTIPKGIVMINNTLGNYFRPEVTFDFEIISGDDLSSTDLGYKPHVSGIGVYPGKPGGLLAIAATNDNSEQTVPASPAPATSTSLHFDSIEVEDVDNDYGKITQEPLQFTTEMAAYAGVDQPGVYRYKITDVTDLDYLKNVGISRNVKYNKDSYVDLYIAIGGDENHPTPFVDAIVVSQVEENVPVRNSNGNIEAKDTNGNTKEYDPAKVYVTDDGTVYTLNDGAPQVPVFPRDYTPTTDKVVSDNLKSGLVKTPDVFNDHPEYDFIDNDGDGVPDEDDDGHHTPKDKEHTEPARDDKGDYVDQDGNSYSKDDYTVDPTTGEIKKNDGSSVDGGPKYAKYVGKYNYEQSDVYETFNVVLKKDISGAMGDKTHKFPFAVSVTNKTLGSATPDPQNLPFTYFKKDADGNVLDADGNIATADYKQSERGAVVLSTSLSHNEEFFIRGLNANAKINIEETNDTSFTYAVTMTGSDDVKIINNVDAKINGGTVKLDDTADRPVAVVSNTSNVFEATNIDYIKISNYQNTVNPTGVVLRFAPYILMLGAAFFFVALSRRRREQENA